MRNQETSFPLFPDPATLNFHEQIERTTHQIAEMSNFQIFKEHDSSFLLCTDSWLNLSWTFQDFVFFYFSLTSSTSSVLLSHLLFQVQCPSIFFPICISELNVPIINNVLCLLQPLTAEVKPKLILPTRSSHKKGRNLCYQRTAEIVWRFLSAVSS